MSDDHVPVRRFMSATPETIDEELTVQDAKERMFRLNVRHLPVLHEGKLIGVLSQRDVAIAEATSSAAAAKISVASVMTQVPFSCGPDAHVEAVAREMAEHHYGSAIVVDPDHPTKVVGVFTTVDALRALAEILEHSRKGAPA